MRDYTHGYPTAYANLGNGQPATLFSSYDQQTVDTHFRWMQQNGCDTAALQRFNPIGGEGPTRDAMAAKVRTAAEAYGRKFYIMYDVTGWTNMQSEIKTDWTTKMSALHRVPGVRAAERQAGRLHLGLRLQRRRPPVRRRPPASTSSTGSRRQGCYVIGGVPT